MPTDIITLKQTIDEINSTVGHLGFQALLRRTRPGRYPAELGVWIMAPGKRLPESEYPSSDESIQPMLYWWPNYWAPNVPLRSNLHYSLSRTLDAWLPLLRCVLEDLRDDSHIDPFVADALLTNMQSLDSNA